MNKDLPEPLVPADCDLRDEPMPREILVTLAMMNFGLTDRQAEAMIEEFFSGKPQ